MAVKRVAIMTGGGDCPGLNAVIRAVVCVGKERFRWEILGVEDSLHGLIDLDYRSAHGNLWLEKTHVHGIIERGGTILGTSNRSDPFEYVMHDADGRDRVSDVSDRVMENFRHLELDALISIGGDGSMRIANRFAQKGMPIVGVPKTIDNDLCSTDQTFGFDTAVNIATEAIDRLRDTASSHHRVMLVELMGRDAGWIALHAGIAGGADVILIPEIPYSAARIAEQINRRRAVGKKHSIIVVAEGARPAGGEASALTREKGAMARLMGAAHRVAHELDGVIDAEMRVTVLGHLQRGGAPSSFDRILATRYGIAAAERVDRGEFTTMVALRNGEIVSVPLDEAAAGQKLVDPSGGLVRNARDLGVSFGDT